MSEIPYQATEVQIPINPLIIWVPALFPYESTQVIPWRYEPKVYRHGQESRPMITNEPNVTIIAGPRGMTHNRRVLIPASVQGRNTEPLAKSKGKEIASNAQNPESPEGISSLKTYAFQK